MDAKHVIEHLQACVDDGEWERGEIYLADLRPDELAAAVVSPRIAGAIVHTLAGVGAAVERHNAPAATSALRHLSYLLDEPAAAL